MARSHREALGRTGIIIKNYSIATVNRVKGSRKNAAGTAFPVSPPSTEAIRRHVEAWICPFCGAGPFTILAGHTTRVHAVDRFALRDLAGLIYHQSITPPEYHVVKSAQARSQWVRTGDRVTTAPRDQRPRVLSDKAKEINRTKLAMVIDAPKQRRAASAARVAQLAQERAENPATCSWCHKPFVLDRRRGNSTRRTCSETCRNASMAARLSEVNALPWQRVCVVCSRIDEGRGSPSRATTCSDRCRLELQSRRARDREERHRKARGEKEPQCA